MSRPPPVARVARVLVGTGAVVAGLVFASLVFAGLVAPAARADGHSTPAIEVLSAVAPAPPPGAPTLAVYLQLRNHGALGDVLLGASTPLAREAMIHEQRIDGGVMRMRMLERLAIPPGGGIGMHAGGIHLMLAGLAPVPAVGGRFPIQLRFERAGAVDATVRVLPMGSAP